MRISHDQGGEMYATSIPVPSLNPAETVRVRAATAWQPHLSGPHEVDFELTGDDVDNNNHWVRRLHIHQFDEVGAELAVADTASGAFAGALADYDNDGDLDLFVVNAGAVNRAFVNLGNGTFLDRAAAFNMTDDDGQSRAVLLGDYDSDGDLDVYVINRGEPNLMYMNGGSQHSWLDVNLHGRESNTGGLGARLTAHAGETAQIREINGMDGFSMSSRTAHFGLGDLRRLDSLTVAWPSGVVDVHRDVRVNSRIHLVEGQRVTAVEEEEARAPGPLQFGLEPNFPNPFNAETRIRYTISQRGRVRLSIYNSLGQLVRNLVDDEVGPGIYVKNWDGRDNRDNAQASGVYFSRLISSAEETGQSMVLLR